MTSSTPHRLRVRGITADGGGSIYVAGKIGSDWVITGVPTKALVLDSLAAATRFIMENDAENLVAEPTKQGRAPGPWWLVLSGITGPTHEKLYFCEIAVDGVVRVSSQKRDSQVWFSESGIPESLRNDPRFDVIGGE